MKLNRVFIRFKKGFTKVLIRFQWAAPNRRNQENEGRTSMILGFSERASVSEPMCLNRRVQTARAERTANSNSDNRPEPMEAGTGW